MESSLILKIAATFGLCLSTPSCKPATNGSDLVSYPYKSHNHNYNYRKGDPCPYGNANKKNGESIRTDDGNRGWDRRSNTETGDFIISTGEFPTGALYRRGHRAFIIERGGHTLPQERGGGRVK